LIGIKGYARTAFAGESGQNSHFVAKQPKPIFLVLLNFLSALKAPLKCQHAPIHSNNSGEKSAVIAIQFNASLMKLKDNLIFYCVKKEA
jgi:hypothetical protein